MSGTTSSSIWATPNGLLICDETGFLKEGTRSAGVQRQCRPPGPMTGTGAPRRASPDEAEFAPKARLAQAMLARAIEAGVPFAWFTADEVYGQAKYLRRWLEERDISCVMATRCSDTFPLDGSEQRADALIAALWR
jgi:SRSO17 transposase